MTDYLSIYVVYKNPRDFPGKYVVRLQKVYSGGRIEICADEDNFQVEDDLNNIHYWIWRHSTLAGRVADCRLTRNSGDDPAIFETWI